MSRNKINLSSGEMESMISIAVSHKQEKASTSIIAFPLSTKQQVSIFTSVAACLAIIVAINIEYLSPPLLTTEEESEFMMELDYTFLQNMETEA